MTKVMMFNGVALKAGKHVKLPATKLGKPRGTFTASKHYAASTTSMTSLPEHVPAPKQYAKRGKDACAVSLGARGGAKGGPARARVLPSPVRKKIARKAASARWHGRKFA